MDEYTNIYEYYDSNDDENGQFEEDLENSNYSEYEYEIEIFYCNFTTQSQCGDAEECHPNSDDCHCGFTWMNEINILNTDLYCCVPPPKDELWCSDPFNCYEGNITSKTVPCQGKCYNDYKIDYNRTLGPQAMFQCDNGKECVRVSAMCQGYALCSDESDLKECDSNLKCTTNTWSTSTIHSLGSGHHYCQYHETDNDGKYDNIGRKDEDTLDVTFDELVIDYNNELEECRNHISEYYEEYNVSSKSWISHLINVKRSPGKTCGETCVENYEWCRTDRGFTCTTNQTEYSANNPKICGNFSLWSEVSCSIISLYWKDKTELPLRGLLVPLPPEPAADCGGPCGGSPPFPVRNWTTAAGKRCLGKQQHCYYPWYSELYTYRENNQGRLMTTCSDKSDQIFELKDCKMFSNYLDEYKLLFCTPTYYDEDQQELKSLLMTTYSYFII